MSQSPVMTKIRKIPPPQAAKKPFEVTVHKDRRQDPYAWLRDPLWTPSQMEIHDPEVLAYLKQENDYTEQVLAPCKSVQEALFEEMKARLKEADASVPYRNKNYFYYTRFEKGQEYPRLCRKHQSLDEEEKVMLDLNLLAMGFPYLSLGGISLSLDEKILAYGVDHDGSERYTIYFKDLSKDHVLEPKIPQTSGTLLWAEDNRHLFYLGLDSQHRPSKVYLYDFKNPDLPSRLIYEEKDSRFFVSLHKSLSKKFIFLTACSSTSSEVRYIPADQPTEAFKTFAPRQEDHKYEVEHHIQDFFILSRRIKDPIAQNGRIFKASVENPQVPNWQEYIGASPDILIEHCHVFKKHLVIHQREGGLIRLKVVSLENQQFHYIPFEEPAYNVWTQDNHTFDSATLRLGYTSLVTPRTIMDYDIEKRTFEIKKVQEIPGGYDKTLYQSERIFFLSPDGVKVPISIVYKKGLKKDGSSPLYLYGYGAYGFGLDPSFSPFRLSLLDRGFVYAVAHIRGGNEMGYTWYEAGKFLKKKNTFSDFIGAAEHLIKEGFTQAGEIIIAGGSAGGMLIGAAVNERPDLFKAAIAHVPFVDVLNTMLDSSLPLTPSEFKEWGNPQEEEYYHYIKSYSPYDNVKTQAYPHLLVTSGISDPRVTYWEATKWVAKLRATKSDENLLLLKTNMDAGHGGPSGRFQSLRELALEYIFILLVFGKVDGH